jgi:hypothetical protein
VEQTITLFAKAEDNMQDGPTLVQWVLFGVASVAVLLGLVVGTIASIIVLARQK